MRIIPVLDLQGGVVVRGVAGKRDDYRPVESVLTDSAAPLDVAGAIRDRLSCTQFYIADLDAIEADRPQRNILNELCAAGFQLMVDAGLRDSQRGRELLEAGCQSIVAGLETLPSPGLLDQWVREFGGERVVFSLDLKSGVPICDPHVWGTSEPRVIAGMAVDCGIERMIVLDLKYVGTDTGNGTRELCRALRRQFPKLELITGGGVRGPRDLKELSEIGVDGVLIASALHNGAIGAVDLCDS